MGKLLDEWRALPRERREALVAEAEARLRPPRRPAARPTPEPPPAPRRRQTAPASASQVAWRNRVDRIGRAA